jgi:hypothetical protein
MRLHIYKIMGLKVNLLVLVATPSTAYYPGLYQVTTSLGLKIVRCVPELKMYCACDIHASYDVSSAFPTWYDNHGNSIRHKLLLLPVRLGPGLLIYLQLQQLVCMYTCRTLPRRLMVLLRHYIEHRA